MQQLGDDFTRYLQRIRNVDPDETYGTVPTGQTTPPDDLYTPTTPYGMPYGDPYAQAGGTIQPDIYTPNLTGGQVGAAYIPTLGSTVAPTPTGPDRIRQGTTAPTPGTTSAAQNRAGSASSEAIKAYIREAAIKRGIDPEIALRIAAYEGGRRPDDPNQEWEPARRGTFATGSSWYPFQLHYGGAGTPYAHFGTKAGMGNDFSGRYGYEPGDPAGVWDSIDFALDAARKSGWGAWYGRGPAGIGEWQGIPR